jgi:sec-independent protein translocase protein TatA
MFAGILGGWEMILILAVILIIFGPKKLPEFARGLGQSLKEFKKASNEVVEEIQNAQIDDHHSRPITPPKALTAPEKTEPRGASVVTTDAPGGQPMAKLDKPVNADLHG